MLNLYGIAQRELAKDLIFEIDGESVVLSIKGAMIAVSNSKNYNFSFIEISENEFVMVVQMGGYVLYIGMESDEEIDEDAYPELFKALMVQLLPVLEILIQEANKMEYKTKRRADILLDDDMSSDMKEFFYQTLIKHIKNIPIYEQTEVA
ncbi:hypothetical protein PAP_06550 [Palaeococcus pacificus DY20341]|uniref:Uncharacterized protein n=1 Tax=Palaeococcus pacificus DY20341 TaxID=1343739 RepID=A0A075LUP0_9EURY|nr:hypothetical protein [Palaeococcus pacificus]AIF69707.1 hypothetical protein PAP_06550 [Palaeococcus pacificus DY20341]